MMMYLRVLVLFFIMFVGDSSAGDPFSSIREDMSYEDSSYGRGIEKLFAGFIILILNLVIFLGWFFLEKNPRKFLYGSVLAGLISIFLFSNNPENYFQISRIFRTLAGSLIIGVFVVFVLYAFAAFLPEGKSVDARLNTEYVEKKSAKPIPAKFSYHKSCYIITIKQWNGGPYWSRAFPLNSVECYLSSSAIKGLTKSQIAGYINDIEDKAELLDHLIDNNVSVIAESIDKSRVRSIRSTNAQAKLTGWDVVFSEYYIATHI